MVSNEEKRQREIRTEIALDKMMEPANLKIEMKDEKGKWVPYEEKPETEA